MQSFIRTDQYNFIKKQVQKLVHGQATSKDEGVISALKSITFERVLALFTTLDEEQEQLLEPIVSIVDKEMAEVFLSQLKPYVIPLELSEQRIKKLFPKAKKLKVPPLNEINLCELTYLSWVDTSSNKKYIVINRDNQLMGVEGSFTPSNHKGICALCNNHSEVGLFQVKEKGKAQGTFKTRGNYICNDSQVCNENLTSLDRLYNFVNLLKS